jgi:hypothetical protein
MLAKFSATGTETRIQDATNSWRRSKRNLVECLATQPTSLRNRGLWNILLLNSCWRRSMFSLQRAVSAVIFVLFTFGQGYGSEWCFNIIKLLRIKTIAMQVSTIWTRGVNKKISGTWDSWLFASSMRYEMFPRHATVLKHVYRSTKLRHKALVTSLSKGRRS